MIKYGIDNVRGGNYVKIELDIEEKKILQSELWGVKDLCKSCGQSGHFIKSCPLNIEKREAKEVKISEVSVSLFKCRKCYKEYKTKAGYDKHILKCGTKVKKDKSKTKCKTCGNPGHKSTGCVVGTDKEEEVVCFKCKQPGHYANACYK